MLIGSDLESQLKVSMLKYSDPCIHVYRRQRKLSFSNEQEGVPVGTVGGG